MSDSGYTPSEIHVAKIIANAASDWVDRCDSDDHALEHSNWEAYISEARAIEAVIREDERQKAIDTIRFHRGGYNRNGSSHKLLLKMEDAILSQSFTGTESEQNG